jgi:hypothetical protein
VNASEFDNACCYGCENDNRIDVDNDIENGNEENHCEDDDLNHNQNPTDGTTEPRPEVSYDARTCQSKMSHNDCLPDLRDQKHKKESKNTNDNGNHTG